MFTCESEREKGERDRATKVYDRERYTRYDVRMCMRERQIQRDVYERQRVVYESERDRNKVRVRERLEEQSACVCVCLCVERAVR